MRLNGKRIVENVIEFVKDSERAAVTFCQGRYKSRIKKLVEERPEECQIVAENQDGSMCAHIPVAWIKINPAKQFSEKQRREIAQIVSNALQQGLQRSKFGLKWRKGEI